MCVCCVLTTKLLPPSLLKKKKKRKKTTILYLKNKTSHDEIKVKHPDKRQPIMRSLPILDFNFYYKPDNK